MRARPALLLLGLAPAGALAEDLADRSRTPRGGRSPGATVILVARRPPKPDRDGIRGRIRPAAGRRRADRVLYRGGPRVPAPSRDVSGAGPGPGPGRHPRARWPSGTRSRWRPACGRRGCGRRHGQRGRAHLAGACRHTAAPALDDALRQVPGVHAVQASGRPLGQSHHAGTDAAGTRRQRRRPCPRAGRRRPLERRRSGAGCTGDASPSARWTRWRCGAEEGRTCSAAAPSRG